MSVAVYGREVCAQCEWTKKHLKARGIAFEEFNVDLDGVAHDTVAHQAVAMGVEPTLPLVIVTDERHRVIDKWFGFKIDKIKGLTHGQNVS